MKQETAVFKLMDSFRQEVKDEIPLEIYLKVEQHLNMAYAVGHDAGIRFKSHKRGVIMFRNEVEIRRFETILLAANHLQVNKSRLSQCIKQHEPCKGYYFLFEK